MDSEDLERERGITIHSKSTSVEFEGVRIHLVDTPGHADFGGEVERVLGMVDAVLLLVDAVEGVMPQTRFVLGKALSHGLRPILVVNKIDRPEQRAAGGGGRGLRPARRARRQRRAARLPGGLRLGQGRHGDPATRPRPRKDLRPLLETILSEAPAPEVDEDGPLQFQAMTLGYDEFLGRLVIGRVERGRAAPQRDRGAHAGDGPPRVLPRDQALRRARPRAGRDRGGRAPATSASSPASTRSTSATRSAIRRRPRRCRASRSIRRPIRVRFSREQLALRRPRGQVRHEPPDRRPAAARGARQRLDQDRAGREPPTPSRWPAAASCRSGS